MNKKPAYLNQSPANRHHITTGRVFLETDRWRKAGHIHNISLNVFATWFNNVLNQDGFFSAAHIERYFLEFVCDDGSEESVESFN